MEKQTIIEIINNVMNQDEGSFVTYEAEDGRSLTFTCMIDEDFYVKTCQILADTGEELTPDGAVKYTEDAEFKQKDMVEEEQEDIFITDEEHVENTEEDIDSNSNDAEDFGADFLPDAEDIFSVLQPEKEDNTVQIPEKETVVINIENETIVEDKSDKKIDGLSTSERNTYRNAQMSAGFIPFELREGRAPRKERGMLLNADNFTTHFKEYRQIDNEFGRILGIDTTSYITRRDDAANYNIIPGIPISTESLRNILSESERDNSKYSDANIDTIKATKQLGNDNVSIKGFGKYPITICAANLVTLDVKFKDGSHLEKTLVVDDFGKVRSSLDFGNDRKLELPIRQATREFNPTELLRIPELDRTSPDNKVSITSHMTDDNRIKFIDIASNAIEKCLEEKIEKYDLDVKNHEDETKNRFEKALENLDESRTNLGRAEFIKAYECGKYVSIGNEAVDKLSEKLDVYNNACKERKQSDLDKNSKEYKALVSEEQRAKKDFLETYKEKIEETKSADVSTASKIYKDAEQKYNQELEIVQSLDNRKVTTGRELYEIKTDKNITSRLEDGKEINSCRAFDKMCITESGRCDKGTVQKVGISNQIEISKNPEYLEHIQDIVDKYNENALEEDKVKINEEGLLVTEKGEYVIPMESCKDEYLKEKYDNIQNQEQMITTDERGNSIEVPNKLADESEISKDDSDTRNKFLNFIRGGNSISDVSTAESRPLNNRIDKLIDEKLTALSGDEKVLLQNGLDNLTDDILNEKDEDKIKDRIDKILFSTVDTEEKHVNDTEKGSGPSEKVDIDKRIASGLRQTYGTYGRIDAEKNVELSDEKKAEIKKEAEFEAREQLGENAKDPTVFEDKVKEIINQKETEAIKDLEEYKVKLEKLEDVLNKTDLNPRLLGNHLGYKLVCNEFDATIRDYMKDGGKTGEGTFISRNVSALERCYSIGHLNQACILDTILIDSFTDAGKHFSIKDIDFSHMSSFSVKGVVDTERFFVDLFRENNETNDVEQNNKDDDNMEKSQNDDTSEKNEGTTTTEDVDKQEEKNVEKSQNDDEINEDDKSTVVTEEADEQNEGNETQSATEELKDELLEVFKEEDGEMSIEEFIVKHEDIFNGETELKNDDIISAFKNAVKESGTDKKETIADVVAVLGSCMDKPIDESVQSLIDSIKDIVELSSDDKEEMLEKVSEALENLDVEKDESGDDGAGIEFTKEEIEDKTSFLEKIDTLIDDLSQLIDKISDVISDFFETRFDIEDIDNDKELLEPVELVEPEVPSEIETNMDPID